MLLLDCNVWKIKEFLNPRDVSVIFERRCGKYASGIRFGLVWFGKILFLNQVCWAEYFRMVDIEVNLRSSLFLNLTTNLILYLYPEKCIKFNQTESRIFKPVNLKFCAPFKINIQKREELYKKTTVFLFYIQERTI